jgi:peptide chain release factor 2
VPKFLHSKSVSSSLLDCSGGVFDWNIACDRLEELNACVEDPSLWNDPVQAQKILRERNRLEASISSVLRLEQDLKDSLDLNELAEMENDSAMMEEAFHALIAMETEAIQRETEALLAGEADGNDTYLEIHAGAGGTESQDWAQILMRMYVRWGERHGCKIELIETTEGEEAGIKSATLLIKGVNAYGWLKTETGVHRLVRISPFDSNARRHTSFSSIWVYPVVDDNIDIVILEKDLRIDVYRASGAGGQHVNRTESAVRITHIPTNIVVQCQNDRSQHKNKATCMAMLKARMYERELKIREEKAQVIESGKTDIGWGHQIRSYVLQPYQLVKDLRTGFTSTSPQQVLDGDLDGFMAASLAQRIEGGTGVVVDDIE